jgi:phosphoglycerol transferase MdoB-like AlkP superfamily enzyme
MIVAVPSISMPVYSFFDIDTTVANNTFKLNEKFENNSFLAFFIQTASEKISNRLKEPETYSVNAVDNYIKDNKDSEEHTNFKKPNVIMIMSEAFADFRTFNQLNLKTDAYDGFDWVANHGYKGTAVVPTFASFTVRTEFELNFGLPVKSLNDPSMPQKLLLNREQPTIARTYKNLGYSTAYVHPFLGSFYDRDTIYKNFDFDKMIFQNDLTVDVDYFNSYISDKTAFNQVEQLIKNTNEPMFIHTTTMQNHQPYPAGNSAEDELNNYLSGIKYSSDSLKQFVQDLDKIDEPTIVFLIGDHFPSLKGDNSIYDELGLNGDNCSVVYKQPYVLWSNYDLNFSSIPNKEISTFYLPYVIMNLIDAPMDNFSQTMYKKMEELPVYSTNYSSEIKKDDELDMLTYDRILGDLISDEELTKNEGN